MADSDPKSNTRFKLPGSSLEEVFKVVQGYTSIDRPASLDDVAKTTGMHKSSISRNVGFLLSLGVLEGGRSKSPTEIGKKLGLALQHNVPEEIERITGDIVAEDEFLKNVLAAVRIRKGMDETSLRTHIAYSAGQSKTGSTTTGTGTVVDLLKRSGHLQPEDGKLVVSAATPRSPVSEPSVSDQTDAAVGPSGTQTIDTTSPFAISIKIEVRCEPQDLDELGIKLRKVVDDFSKETGTTDDYEE